MAIPAFGVDPNRFAIRQDISPVMQGLGQLGQAYQQRQAQEQEALRQQEAQRIMQQKTAEASQVFRSGDTDAMADFMMQNPEFQKQMQAATQFRNEATKQKRIEGLKRIVLGEPNQQVAAETSEFIRQQGGTTEETDAFGKLPQQEAIRIAGMELALLMEPQQYKNFMQASGATTAREQQDGRTAGIKDFDYYQKLKKENPQMAKEFGQERGFITKEGRELSGHLQKRLSSATDEAIESEANVGKFDALANEIDASDLSGGLFGGKWKETFKEITGTQDAVSELRKRYFAIRGSQVVNNLPPGAASDTDIALALAGFPSDKANKKQLSSFLRGLSKLERIKADYANFRSNYISEKGSERDMLKAWNSRTEERKPAPTNEAPAQAVEYLRQNPQLAEQFRAKYGYLPEGM